MRHDQRISYAGGLGMSAGLLTYTAFNYGSHLRVLGRITPYSFVALSLFYGFYFNDKSVLGGTSAGYLAILLAL